MVTRVLHDAGLHLIGRDTEELISAAEDNPEGFWENRAIVACNDELLEATGGSWDNPPTLPPQGADDPRVASVVEAAETALAGLREHRRWGFKDPRLCLTAPFWLDLLPDLRFVICVRHPLEVALSLKRRNQNSYSLGLELWERYYSTILATVPPDRRIVSHYDSFFIDPEAELARVCAFAGLEPESPRVRHDLRHHTIQVSLADAGVSPGLRTLYASLCREAGVPVAPDAPTDEGRVRRLVLDGAVAAHQAEQRLAAVKRLEQREHDFRAEHAASEEALRVRIRDLERRLAETPAVVLQRLARRSARKSATAGGRALAKAKRSSAPIARRADRLLAHMQPSRTRPAPSAVEPEAPNARATDHRGTRPAHSQPPPPARNEPASGTRNLPPSVDAVLRTSWRRIRTARAAPRATARNAVARMPGPARQVSWGIWRKSAEARRRGGRLVRRVAPTLVPAATVPKGPPFRTWKHQYTELVQLTIPGDAAWLVAAPGSPPGVRIADRPRSTRFPDTPRGVPMADDLAHIAHLEALRCEGNRFLVVPEGSRRWFRRQGELRRHVLNTYGCLADERGAGIVFDLRAAASHKTTLDDAVQRLTGAAGQDPAVLDWTDLSIARELAGITTFKPPAGPRLPYLDDSIEIVVRDEQRDQDEARRVATRGVVTVEANSKSIEVLTVEDLGPPGEATIPHVLVRSTSRETGDEWSRALAARVAEAGAHLELGPIDGSGSGETEGYDVVMVVEPDVLPLPGAITAAAALALAQPDRAITGKVIRADGRLDSAGGTVFFDRSVALIAEGSADVRGPWHDYVRPVCWAPGFVAMSTGLWAAVDAAKGAPPRTLLREWCAAVWEHGASVAYEPMVGAVRVTGSGGEAAQPLQASAWQRVLDLRPRRPAKLGDGEWQYLLAHDDVEACRG